MAETNQTKQSAEQNKQSSNDGKNAKAAVKNKNEAKTVVQKKDVEKKKVVAKTDSVKTDTKKKTVSENTTKKSNENKKVHSKNSPLAHGVGRRKSSVARVWMRRGKGEVLVNGKEHKLYFDNDTTRFAAVLSLHKVFSEQNIPFDFFTRVSGGGKNAQADAVKLAIARALVVFDEQNRSILRKEGLLTVDSRVKEPKKYGQRGARRKFQFTKR